MFHKTTRKIHIGNFTLFLVRLFRSQYHDSVMNLITHSPFHVQYIAIVSGNCVPQFGWCSRERLIIKVLASQGEVSVYKFGVIKSGEIPVAFSCRTPPPPINEMLET